MSSTVALVTGASRGLGLAIAREYARRGLGLILTARNRHELHVAAEELRATTDVLTLAGDVADQLHAEALVAAGLQRFGHIDVLINNASELGPSPMPQLQELGIDDFETILQVNLVAPLRLSQLVLPGMRAAHSGLIVNVTSDAGVQAYPTWGGYGASKAGLEQLSRIMAAELEGSGVRVYVVDPGDMNTAMHAAAEPGVDLSGLPDPEVVAPAFVRLLDESAPSGRFEAQRLVAARAGG
jgi:NAD(P)-dependent dehydrogenase (short-subunit alcohol dehydrogenase family)